MRTKTNPDRSLLQLACAALCLLCFVIFPSCTSVTLGSVHGTTYQLEKIEDIDITPPGSVGVRPNAIILNKKIYVAYLQIKPSHRFRLVTLNNDGEVLSAVNLYSGKRYQDVTDVRLATADDSRLWYVFETCQGRGAWKNRLNLAEYDVQNGQLILRHSLNNAAKGNLLRPGINIPNKGDEMVDDPTPFFHNDRYWVLTKTFESSIVPVRSFSSSFKLEDSFDLDLGKALNNCALSVNSLVALEDGIWLISGANTGPPVLSNSKSRLVAVPLSNDLCSVRGKPVFLSTAEEYATYVSGASYSNGKLYIVHNVNNRKLNGDIKGYLKVYDVQNKFAQLVSVLINEGGGGLRIDNHLSLVVSSNKAHVFYYTPGGRLRMKTLRVREVVAETLISEKATEAKELLSAPEQTRPEDMPQRSSPPRKDFMRDFDRNGDGVVVRNEFPGPLHIFRDLDTDRNGRITAAEVSKQRQPLTHN